MDDTFKTIEAVSEGVYTEKRSKFIAVALPVTTVEEVKEHLDVYRKKYFDARHLCYAYMLGAARTDFRANDNGEPSGTAGKPILGQINSFELTDVLVLVVRYFGGIKLGTGGLTAAYKTVAAEALASATVVEKVIVDEVKITFPYSALNDVLRIVKDEGGEVAGRLFEVDCRMKLHIKKSQAERLRERLRLYSVEHGRIVSIDEKE